MLRRAKEGVLCIGKAEELNERICIKGAKVKTRCSCANLSIAKPMHIQ